MLEYPTVFHGSVLVLLRVLVGYSPLLPAQQPVVGYWFGD